LIVAYNEQVFPCFIGDRTNVIDVVSDKWPYSDTMVSIAVKYITPSVLKYEMF
jgi:hypothetical protein